MHNKLTWLHISDIHFHPKTEWRDNISRSSLITYLKNIFDSGEVLRPDFIFCTGDIAFGQTSAAPLSEQYSQAKIFFETLLVICGQDGSPLPKERLYIVPGNHDVNRRMINTDSQITLINWASKANDHIESINQRFNDRTREFEDTIRRLDEYSQFVKEFLPHQYDESRRQHYAIINDFHGLKIGIAGFNSAWTCAGPEDDRNIWLAASWQFNTAYELLSDADIRFGLIHHPTDWLNMADREIATRRISSDFDFWLHGHTHSAWVTPIQSHIILGAGAIGAESSDEFGINITTIDLSTSKGIAHLHNKKAGNSSWTIAPINDHAPTGKWPFDLPVRMRKQGIMISNEEASMDGTRSNQNNVTEDFVARFFNRRLHESLISFSSQPLIWTSRILSRQAEITRDAKSAPKVNISDFITTPKSTFIKAPPQYGLTCLAHFMVVEAWKSPNRSLWLYLDSKELKPYAASIDTAIMDELSILGCYESDIKCVIIDSWTTNQKDAFKLLKLLCDRFKNIPIICMEQIDGNLFKSTESLPINREFEVLFLWSLPRNEIRRIVAAYNETKQIGEEDAVTSRLVSDLEVLNLHRTPLNCLTLLKVSEIDFDESPVNRSEMIKRVLFILFNTDEIPTYKLQPDLKDCEYVLGYFCEFLIKEEIYGFTRDQFLKVTQKCCVETLIDLEVHVVFDVLYSNNIIIKRGNLFNFKFAYWIFYFAAQRMHHNAEFANFIFDQMRYAQHPELIEFYTGIDRRREDALQVLLHDIQISCDKIKEKCGLPEGLNPYRHFQWIESDDSLTQMQQEIANGVLESNLPAEIKDQYADRSYDQTRPYNQDINRLLTEHSFVNLMKVMQAGARALRNSDYVSPNIKRKLLCEILNCWEQAARVLFLVLPNLAMNKTAIYDGAQFVLTGHISDSPHERIIQILNEIPDNIVNWFQDDLFSQKMGPLLIDQLMSQDITEIKKHMLMLLIIKNRPREWSKYTKKYIVSNSKNSFYLYDTCCTLRSQYRYGFVSTQTLQDIDYLIRMAAAKHITGSKEPGVKMINNIKFADDVIPQREI